MVAFNHVGRVNQLANLGRVLEESRMLLSIVSPGTDNERVLGTPDFLKAIQFKKRSLLGCCLVNGFEIRGNFLEIFVRHVTVGVSDLVNDTLLNLGLWITGGNRLGEATQIIYADDEDVLNTAVLQVASHVFSQTFYYFHFTGFRGLHKLFYTLKSCSRTLGAISECGRFSMNWNLSPFLVEKKHEIKVYLSVHY